MPYIPAHDGTPLYYRDEGEGPVLVLLQGLTMTVEGFWIKNLETLARSCRVIAIDHRSHGLSGKPMRPHSIAQCADDLKHVLDRLGVKKVTLGGFAFGAMVTLEYIRRFGDHRLSRMAIIEAHVRLTNTAGWDHPLFGDFSPEAEVSFVEGCLYSRKPLTKLLNSAFGSPPSETEIARMQAEAWLTPTQAAIEFAKDMIASDYREDLSNITLPTLLMFGRMDNTLLPSKAGDWLAQQIPNSKIENFEDAGHLVFYESPEKFNTVLIEFVVGGLSG